MYLNLVREIKAAIMNSETLPNEFIVELSAEYRQACDEVNRRLIEVTSLLEMGCRDEAVQVADHPRSLLDSIRELNFKQRKDWVQVLADKKLEVPPRLEFHSATRLQDAYEKLDELAPLLKKNRLLALAQAPLKSRIVVLNQLIQNDPENQVWKLDLAALQEARLVEIKDELRKAKKAGDGDKARDLTAELSGPWSVEVPQSLTGDALKSLNDIGMVSHLRDMEEIADKLNKCLLETDEKAALPLRKEWIEHNKLAKLQPNDPLAQKAREPLAWLENLQQQRVADRNYLQATTDLEHAIDKQFPLEELDKRTSLVSNFGRDGSEGLLERSQTYRKTLLHQQHRQTRIQRYVMIACAAVALLVAGWFGLNQYRQGQLDDYRASLKKFVNDDALESGQRYYQQLPAFAKSDNEISQLHARMASLEKDENERISMFNDAISRIDLEKELGDEADNLIDRARQHASTGADNQRLQNLKQDLDNARKKRQQQRTENYLTAAKPLETELAAMLDKVKAATAMPEAITGVVEKLQSLKNNALQRTDGLAGITLTAKHQTEELIEEANLMLDRSRQKKKSAVALTTLKEQAVKLRNLGSALTRFEKLYPQNPNSRDFKLSAGESNHWNGLRMWQDAASTVSQYNIEKIGLQELKTLRDEMLTASELTKLTNWPESLESTTKFLTSMTSDRSDLLRQLGDAQAFFQQKNFTEIHVLHRDGKRYYLTHEFNPNDRKFSYYKRGQDQEERRYQDDKIAGLAGHCKLAKDIARQFENFNGDTDRALLELLAVTLVRSKELTVMNGPNIDPLVQADFVNEIMILIEQTSPLLKTFAARQRELLKRAQVIGLPWRNVQDETANKARPKAVQTLDTIRRNYSDAQKLLDDNMESMKTWTQVANYDPVGIIYMRGEQWIADMEEPVEDGTPLYCLLPGRNGSSSLNKVGSFSNGFVDQGNSVLPLQAGRPIFVINDQQKQ